MELGIAGRTGTAADDTRSTTEVRAGTSYFREAGVEHTVANEGEQLLDFVEVELRSRER